MQKISKNLTVKVLTGLHIGMGGDKAQIGGIDNPFIKDPVSQLPYIPGSSIKGKLRCLLETEGGYGENDKTIKTFFGSGDAESPTRFIFRDLKLNPAQAEKYMRGDIQTEIKTEIKIDRKSGKASPGALRTTERIPPDTLFEGTVLLRYENEEELQELQAVLLKAIKLLNNDFLGGSGSRGYGAVEITIN